MSDDLKSRLRSVGGVRHDGATRWYINPDGPEAADRIEKLEAALTHIYAWYPISIADPHKTIEEIRKFARNSLEGEDD